MQVNIVHQSLLEERKIEEQNEVHTLVGCVPKLNTKSLGLFSRPIDPNWMDRLSAYCNEGGKITLPPLTTTGCLFVWVVAVGGEMLQKSKTNKNARIRVQRNVKKIRI